MEKELKTRVQHKHDIEANWSKAINFIPKAGELIVYDPDDSYKYSRMKMGDGTKTINDLPFVDDTKANLNSVIRYDVAQNLSADERHQAVRNLNLPNMTEFHYIGTSGSEPYVSTYYVSVDEKKIDYEKGLSIPAQISPSSISSALAEFFIYIKSLGSAGNPIYKNMIPEIINNFLVLLENEVFIGYNASSSYVSVDFKIFMYTAYNNQTSVAERFVFSGQPKNDKYAITRYDEREQSIGTVVFNSSNEASQNTIGNLKTDTTLTKPYMGADAQAVGVALEEIRANIIQPDWNAADGENGHILNRTHYKESAFVTVIDSTINYDSYEAGHYAYGLTPAVGNRYKVSIDGDVEQEFTLAEDMVYVYVHSSNGKTYTLNFYDGWYSVYIVVSDNSEDSFILHVKEEQTVYHTIPKEYLPDLGLVGRMYEGSDGGEIFNKADVASGTASHAEGYDTKSTGAAAHSEGWITKSSGNYSHAEGYRTEAIGEASHAEGNSTIASGEHSHTEGNSTIASGAYSHAEGNNTVAIGDSSHVEGKYNFLEKYIIGEPVIKTGANSTIRNYYSDEYIFDAYTGTFKLSSYTSYSSGYTTIPEGKYFTSAKAGKPSIKKFLSYDGTNGTYEEVSAVENPERIDKYVHMIGNGTSSFARSNAHTLDWDGNAWYQGDVYVSSTSGTNRDEGSKKLATEDYVDAAIADIDIETASENDAVELLMEMNVVAPLTTPDNKIITDSQRRIYSL